MLLPKYGIVLPEILLALACGESEAKNGTPDRTGSGGVSGTDGSASGGRAGAGVADAAAGSPSDGTTGALAGMCRFAHAPLDSIHREDVINALSERLSAPPGGLWWLAGKSTAPTVAAESETLGRIELVVVSDRYDPGTPFTVLRVPETLHAGDKLSVGCRELVVEEPLSAPNLETIVFEAAYRPDLGGTGFVVRMPPSLRSRVFVKDAYIVGPSAAFFAGVRAIQGLLLADAPALCGLPVAPGASELFLPMYGGTIGNNSLGVTLQEADNLDNILSWRLCVTRPFPTSTCLPSTADAIELVPAPRRTR